MGRQVIFIGEVHDISSSGQPPGIWGGKPPSYVDIGGPPPQPGVWPGPGYPTHPIAPGGQPPGIWGGTPPNYPDIGGPPPPTPSHPIAPGGAPPVIWPPDGTPTHPIAPGGTPPLEIWGGAPLPHPDQGLPEGERVPKVEWKTAWSPTTGWVVVGVPTVPVPTPSA
jgi:hypothetical protein